MTWIHVDRSGSPTVGSALLRILYAIPSLIVLAVVLGAAALGWPRLASSRPGNSTPHERP